MASNPYLGHPISDISMARPQTEGACGAVSSNSGYATRAGLEILKQGGNAIDAAVAVSLVLGVVEPYHSGIGGGCFHIVYHKESGRFYSADARGVAPLGASRDMFLDENGEADMSLTEFSGRSCATPALYRAMNRLLKKFGTMTWAQVSGPAIRLCREGFCCEFLYARASDSPEAEHNRDAYEGFGELYLNNRKPRAFGELITNPDLAATMEGVAEHGVEWFYEGPVADDIIHHVNKHHGVMTKEDLSGCQPKECAPVRGSYRGYEVVSMAPPSSGGSHIIQMLNILEQFDLKGMGWRSADSTHLLAETMKLMFADRSVAMGDPKYVNIQLEKLLSKEYAGELAAKIDMKQAQAFSPTDGIEAKAYRGCTTHFSIMDMQGNVVVQTQTVRNWWGSGVVIPGRGFLVNNTMADFSPKVGVRTSQGLAYGMANAIQPGKTPLSSMAPTIILKDGVPYLAVGAAGGPRIITSTLQTILNAVDYGMMIEASVRAPHMCCLTREQGLELEDGFSPDTIRILEERGHRIIPTASYANLLVMPNGVQYLDGVFYAAGCSRTGGAGGVLTASGSLGLDGICFC